MKPALCRQVGPSPGCQVVAGRGTGILRRPILCADVESCCPGIAAQAGRRSDREQERRARGWNMHLPATAGAATRGHTRGWARVCDGSTGERATGGTGWLKPSCRDTQRGSETARGQRRERGLLDRLQTDRTDRMQKPGQSWKAGEDHGEVLIPVFLTLFLHPWLLWDF